LTEEVGHPIEAVWCRRSAWAPKSVTTIDERVEISAPSTDGVGDGGVTLGDFVDLVEAGSVVSIPGLGFGDEIVDSFWGSIPEHDTDTNTGILDGLGDVRGPKVEHYDTGGSDEEANPWVIFHGPGDSELSARVIRGGRRRSIGGSGSGSGGRRSGIVVVIVPIDVVYLGGGVRRLRSGSSGRGRTGRGSGLAVTTTLLLLLGNTVMVGNVPSDVVTLDDESGGLGGSERAQEDSESGEGEYV